MGLNGITSSQDTMDLLQQAAEQRAAAQQAQEQKVQQQTVANVDGSSVEEQAVQTNAETLAAAADVLLDGTDDDSNQTLITKANSGAELTNSELSELKELDPELYARVVKAQQARAELKAQMQQSPSQAGKAAQTAIARIADDDEDGALVRGALQNVYDEFASKYDQAEF